MILVVIPALALAALSLAAFLGGSIWWLDVIANFRAQFVIVLALLGLLVAVTKWKRWSYPIFAAAVVNGLVVLPLFVGAPPDPVAGLPDLRVLSFNLLSTNESYSEVGEYIASVDPDVVLLHEASRPWEVAMSTGPSDYEVVVARSDDLIFGTLVMVKGEDVEVVSHGFSTSSPRAVSVSFVPEGWPTPVTVLGSHPLAPTNEERAGLRDAQIGFISEWVNDQNGPHVVAGDLNATPWSWPYRLLLAETELESSQRGFGLQPTFPTDSNLFLRVPIDHVLVSSDLSVVERSLGSDLGSDHFPLLVDLQLKAP